MLEDVVEATAITFAIWYAAGYEGVVSTFCAEFPAAATKRMFSVAASAMAEARAEEYPPPPHELLVATTRSCFCLFKLVAY